MGHLVQLISERLDPNYDGVITKEELKLLKQSCLIGGSGRGARPNSKGRGDSRGNSRPQSSPRESRSRGARLEPIKSRALAQTLTKS